MPESLPLDSARIEALLIAIGIAMLANLGLRLGMKVVIGGRELGLKVAVGRAAVGVGLAGGTICLAPRPI